MRTHNSRMASDRVVAHHGFVRCLGWFDRVRAGFGFGPRSRWDLGNTTASPQRSSARPGGDKVDVDLLPRTEPVSW